MQARTSDIGQYKFWGPPERASDRLILSHPRAVRLVIKETPNMIRSQVRCTAIYLHTHSVHSLSGAHVGLFDRMNTRRTLEIITFAAAAIATGRGD